MPVKVPKILALPEIKPACNRWIILGLDPSLSSTGFALLLVDTDKNSWYEVGSVAPASTHELSWIRAKAMGVHITTLLRGAEVQEFLARGPAGLMLSYEAPTPGNDFLATASICVRLTIRDDEEAMGMFTEHWELMTNAMTMRSIMGLTQKGSKNKKENQAKAWEFMPELEFPNLDTDACDGALFAVLGLWVARLFRDGIEAAKAPANFKSRFCDTTGTYKVVTRGLDGKVVPAGQKKGLKKEDATKEHVSTGVHGVLHDPRYWFPYSRQGREVKFKDARGKKGGRLGKTSYQI